MLNDIAKTIKCCVFIPGGIPKDRRVGMPHICERVQHDVATGRCVVVKLRLLFNWWHNFIRPARDDVDWLVLKVSSVVHPWLLSKFLCLFPWFRCIIGRLIKRVPVISITWADVKACTLDLWRVCCVEICSHHTTAGLTWDSPGIGISIQSWQFPRVVSPTLEYGFPKTFGN